MPKYSRRNSLKNHLKVLKESFKKKSFRRKSLRGGARPPNLEAAQKI